jgi:hypothetical protein
MADDITNIVLLNHMQMMKGELQEQIASLDTKIVVLDGRLTTLTVEVRKGFEDVRLQLLALQEDLEATIRMVGKHDRKLARL